MSKPGQGDNSIERNQTDATGTEPETDGLRTDFQDTIRPTGATTGDTSAGTQQVAKLPPETGEVEQLPTIEVVTEANPKQSFFVYERYSNTTTDELYNQLDEQRVTGDMTAVTGLLYNELIGRSDNIGKTAPSSIAALQRALDANRAFEDTEPGEFTPAGGELTPDERVQYHKAIAQDLHEMLNGVTLRRDMGFALHSRQSTFEAQPFIEASVKAADELPADLIKKQVELMRAEKIDNPELKKAFDQFAQRLEDSVTGQSALSLSTRRDAVLFNLGTDLLPGIDDQGKIISVHVAHGERKIYNPGKAFELAQEVRQKTIELTGKDPLEVRSQMDDALVHSPKPPQPDFATTNIYAITSQLALRSHGEKGRVDAAEFGATLLDNFDQTDLNKDGILDYDELDKLSKSATTDKEKQIASALDDTRIQLTRLGQQGDWASGLRRDDIQDFLKQQKASTDQLEKIRDARARLLYTDEFATADANGNKYLTQRELRKFIADKSSTMTPGEVESFKYLSENFDKISRSWWGIQRQDIKDMRPNIVTKVESALWKAYYKTGPTVSDR